VIIEADKGSAVVIWDREDYLQEEAKQLGDNETHDEVFGDCISPLIKTIKSTLSKINTRGIFPKKRWLKISGKAGLICYRRFTKGFLMFLEDL